MIPQPRAYSCFNELLPAYPHTKINPRLCGRRHASRVCSMMQRRRLGGRFKSHARPQVDNSIVKHPSLWHAQRNEDVSVGCVVKPCPHWRIVAEFRKRRLSPNSATNCQSPVWTGLNIWDGEPAQSGKKLGSVGVNPTSLAPCCPHIFRMQTSPLLKLLHGNNACLLDLPNVGKWGGVKLTTGYR